MKPVEYRAVMRLLYLKSSAQKEALDEMKAVYREDAPSYDVKHWHCKFKCRCTSVETVPIFGHPLSAIDDATIQQFETTIMEDRRVTERQLIHEVKISVVSVEKIIHGHLHMGTMSARWIPWLLTLCSHLYRSKEWIKCAKTHNHVPRQSGGLY